MLMLIAKFLTKHQSKLQGGQNAGLIKKLNIIFILISWNNYITMKHAFTQ